MNRLFWNRYNEGLLILRIAFGLMMMVHGWSKMQNWGAMSQQFADPFGIGSAPSLALAIFAEFFCSALLVLGLFTPLAAVFLIVTMLVAVFYAHGSDPWQKKELAFAYLMVYTTLLTAGAGTYSLDNKLFKGNTE